LNELIRQFVDMSASRCSAAAPKGLCGFGSELTRLNGDRQFKPFVYLNGRIGALTYRSDDGRISLPSRPDLIRGIHRL
jgi:hypothetical protein